MTDRQEIMRKLVEFLESDTEIRLDNLDEALSLREGLGLDSVDLVGVIMRIEGHYRIRLTHSELEKVATVGSLLDLIQAKIAEGGVLAAAIEGGVTGMKPTKGRVVGSIRMNPSPSSTRSLLFLCACCGCWAFGFGLECPLASRWLQDAGHSETFIGFNTGTHFLGVILMGAFAPALMRRFGRRSLFAGLLLSGSSVAVFPWGGGAAGWFLLRLLAGAGGALAMIGLETLINLHSPPERRGRTFAFYACSVGIGFALGSFAGLLLFSAGPELSFALGGGVTLLAVPLVPLLPEFPERPEHEETSSPFRAPLLSIGSSWSQGFLEAGMLALLPLYLKTVGMSDRATGTLIGGILLGVLLCQVPLGWLADRLGREPILIGCFVIVAVGLAVVPNADHNVGLPIWLFVIGVCSGAFYPLGLALLGERLPASEIPRANAWYLGVNCSGSLVSPMVSGPIMEYFGPQAMFWTAEAVVVSVLLIWLMMKWTMATRKA